MKPDAAPLGRSWPHVFAGIVVCALAAVALRGAWVLPIGTLKAPEAGFVPLVEAVLLALAGVVLTASAWRGWAAARVDWPRNDARRMVVHLAAALFGYVLLLGPLGFTGATFVFLWTAIVAWRKYPWWVAGGYALAMAIVLHLVFRVALRMSLPPGWWAS